jgi:hypothetical protein
MTPNMKSIYLERDAGYEEYQYPIFEIKRTEGAVKMPRMVENLLVRFIDGHAHWKMPPSP